MAIVMLASTKITIATCTQIQNGDTPYTLAAWERS